MERPSLAMLVLTTMCFTACDSGSAPPEKQRESPAPASQAPAPSAEREEPPSATANKQPPRAAPPPPPAAPPPPAQSPGGRGESTAQSFSVYALSRGSGVPPAAREAQQRVQALVESDRSRGVDVKVQTTRLGLEGERKLCVTYADAQEAARALERVRAMVQGVDLVNVVVEPCK